MSVAAPDATRARDLLELADSAAWQEYASAVHRRLPMDVRRGLFSRALGTLGELVRFDRMSDGDRVSSGDH